MTSEMGGKAKIFRYQAHLYDTWTLFGHTLRPTIGDLTRSKWRERSSH
jgi:hypothetical protein